MTIFSKQERDLWLLTVKSQLACQEDAIQKYTTLCRVPKRFVKFRFEKLYRIANRLYPKKNIVLDYEYFEECMN